MLMNLVKVILNKKIKHLFAAVMIAVSALSFGNSANAIEIGVCKLSSCSSGYYLASGVCLKCPAPGSSNNKNAGAITSCYISSDVPISDEAGTFTYASSCPYSN